MLPFRPRAPVFGGKLKKKKKAEAEAAAEVEVEAEATCASTPSSPKGTKKKNQKWNSVASLAEGGGPVERAIKGDLVSLRLSFLDRYDRSHSGPVNGAVFGSMPPRVATIDGGHEAEGLTFCSFKDAFREGKFGIVHTRCLPPRCDRAEYTQLLYSACLGLLEEALAPPRRDGSDSGGGSTGSQYGSRRGGRGPDGGDGCDATSRLLEAAFSIFSLYSLYETNPLPSFPTARMESGNLKPRNNFGRNPFSEKDREALSTLTMGLVSEGPSKGLFRRCYREPIRISRRQYAMIHMVRDMSLEVMAKCDANLIRYKQNDIANQMSALKSMSATGKPCVSSKYAAVDQSTMPSGWQCTCGIAQDCIHVVDRMCDNNFFDLCEYSGPCSLEGLGGSADYFSKVIEKEAESSTRAEGLASPVPSDDLKSLKERALNLDSELDFTKIDVLKTEYQKSLGSLHARLMPSGRNDPLFGQKRPQQLSLAHESLAPLFYKGENSEEQNVAEQVRKAYDPDKSTHTHEKGKGPGVGENGSSVKTRRMVMENTTQAENESMSSNQNEADGATRIGPRVVYPPGISKPLRRGIKHALKDVLSNISIKDLSHQPEFRKQITRSNDLDNTKGKGVGKSQRSFSFFFDDTASFLEEEGDSLLRSDDAREKADLSQDDDESDDLASRASTLVGQNALHHLLSKAHAFGRNRLSSVVKIPRQATKRKTEGRKRTSDYVSSSDDDEFQDGCLFTDEDGQTFSDSSLDGFSAEFAAAQPVRLPALNDWQSITSEDGGGQAALGLLLAKVETSRREQSSRKFPAVRSKESSDMYVTRLSVDGRSGDSSHETESVATSKGAGQAALVSLLDKVKANEKPTRTKRAVSDRARKSRPASKRRATESAARRDVLAISSRSMTRHRDGADGKEQPGAKIGNQNARGFHESQPTHSEASIDDRNQNTSEYEEDTETADTSSVSTGAGRYALRNLLSRAKKGCDDG